MRSLFLLQFSRLKRAPLLVITMMGMTLVFVVLFGGFGASFDKLEIPTYFAEEFESKEKEQWFDRLNESEAFNFVETNKEEATRDVALGYSNFALEIGREDYRILMTSEHPNAISLKQYFSRIFEEEVRLRQISLELEDDNFRETVLTKLETPAIEVQSATLTNENKIGYNQRLQSLFGMTLFFVIYTIMFSLTRIAWEKRTKTWDRLILSPLKKWQIYLGYMGYALLIGFAQVSLILIVFKYIFDYPLGDSLVSLLIVALCYSFVIVALGMLLLGLCKSVEQLNAIISIVTVSMSMLGGAYWPIEIVTNKVILAISKFIPVTYGMDALKRISMGGQSLADIADQLGILLLMGVIFVGIGINLMERRE